MNIKSILLGLLFLTFHTLINGQTVTVTTQDTIRCCNGGIYPHFPYSDSLDVNNDGKYDILVFSNTIIDGSCYADIPMDTPKIQTNLMVVLNDSTFPQKYWSISGGTFINNTGFGCFWGGWVPNTGYRYLGYRDTKGPADTIYGWIKLNFVGLNDGSCQDTVYIVEYAYDTIPNQPLRAGNTTLTSIEEIYSDYSINVYPNPTTGLINIINQSSESLSAELTNLEGQLCITKTVNKESSQQLDISYLSDGIYILNINTGHRKKTYKINKSGKN